MFNNNGRTGPAVKHTFHPPHPTVVEGTHVHRKTHRAPCIHRHSCIITHTLTHTIMIHTHALCREMCSSHTPIDTGICTGVCTCVCVCPCVLLYDQCWPQCIWPSFRNNGHGEWLAGRASSLREVTGGMLNDMPHMERWSTRWRERRKKRVYIWVIRGKNVLLHWAREMFWLGADRGWGKEKEIEIEGATAGKNIWKDESGPELLKGHAVHIEERGADVRLSLEVCH